MQAYVYKSRRRADTYIFLAARLPDALRTGLGELSFVLAVDLVPGRRLALSDPEVVRANLVQCGFHLQLPPTDALRAAAVQAGEIDD